VIWNPDAETMPRAARERLQLERLQDTLRWAVEHVAFHQERLGTTTIGTLADLASLPFVRKTDLREQYPFGLLAVPRREVARIHASPGTKGTPTVAAYTAGDPDVWREAASPPVIPRSRRCIGAPPSSCARRRASASSSRSWPHGRSRARRARRYV
jgi:phenylacetate-coenzyme A ligase PaaK-like adenylate-forming protein